MDAKLVLLINFLLVGIGYSTSVKNNAANHECQLYDFLKSEMLSSRQELTNFKQEMTSAIEEIRQIMTQKQNQKESQTCLDLKSEIEDILQIMLRQQGCNGTQASQEIRSKIEEIQQILTEQNDDSEEIRQIVMKLNEGKRQAAQAIIWTLEEMRETMLEQHGNESHAMLEMKLKIEEIHKSMLKHHDNETHTLKEMKLKSEEIRQIVLRQHVSETQSAHEMKSRINEIYQFVIQHQINDTQAMKELKSNVDEIRQAMIQQQNRPKKECPFGFDYLSEAKSCYAIIFEEMSWSRATDRCRGILPGAHLAAITSLKESDDVTSYLRSQFGKTNTRSSGVSHWCPDGYLVWISGQKKNPGQCSSPFFWKALNGIQVPFSYTNWGRGEPNCSGDEGCVHIASCLNLAWNDLNCNYNSFPLCEI